MSAFGIAFIVLEAVAAALLGGLVFLLAKPKAATEKLTVNNAEEETAAAVSSDPIDEPDSEPLGDIESEELADEITTDDETDGEPAFSETAEATAVSSPDAYRLAKSFTAKLILSDDVLKERYSEIKNALLSYKKVKARTSWKCETFRYGRVTLAKIAIRGKKLRLYLALSAEDITDSKYKVESAGTRKVSSVTPTMYKVFNGRRLKNAKQLIAVLAHKHGLTAIERQAENFAPAYQTEEELLSRGLIRKVKGSAFIQR